MTMKGGRGSSSAEEPRQVVNVWAERATRTRRKILHTSDRSIPTTVHDLDLPGRVDLFPTLYDLLSLMLPAEIRIICVI